MSTEHCTRTLSNCLNDKPHGMELKLEDKSKGGRITSLVSRWAQVDYGSYTLQGILQPWISLSYSNGEVHYYIEIPQVDGGNFRKGIDLNKKEFK
jgi:hypothetical protein